MGIAALALLPSGVTTGMAADGMVMAAAVLGFAFFNWHPARMFMGDVGSIPLGFIMGYLLLLMASHGALAAALILPAYYVADASYTLLRRLLRGDAVWQSHSQHFYQQAVRSGRAHDAVVREIIALNLVLYVLAGASTLGGVYAVASVALAYALAGMLMFRFRNRPQILEKAAHAH